jgi:multidrug efflux pump subunit AcrB
MKKDAYIQITLLPERDIHTVPVGMTGHAFISELDSKLAKKALAMEVNGALWDLTRPLEDGTQVPFSQVAQVQEGRGYATINRADQRRIVSVTADVDESVNSANDINEQLRTVILPGFRMDYPGLSFGFEGEQRQRSESMGSLKRDFVIALLAIYALLAIQFRSYAQPLIIMSAIPFGLIGAVIGHVIMGYNLTFLSMFGIVALTGVVVNDSLILIDLINRRRHEETSTTEIVLTSTLRRFRPIILTTLTTFFGLMPMILETSLQAKILIPMAVSLGFGVLFATVITLLITPSLYMILEDIKTLFSKKH